MSDVMDFGFDDSKIIKSSGVEVFKQNRHAEFHKVSIIAFKKFHDDIIVQKTREKGSQLTDEEKSAIHTKIDSKLAEQLSKPVDKLTEVDRLNIKKPRFSVAYTHFSESVGTIRCLSKYEGPNVVKMEECCKRFGDADQKIGTIIMTYPLNDGQIDYDLLKMKKYTYFYVYVMSAKKFKKVESVYQDARNDKREIIDLKLTLDGDAKFQKQLIECSSTAYWAREDCDPDIRNWILEQGLRSYKYVSNNLGFEMKLDKLMEKISGKVGSVSSASSAEAPKLIQSYEDLLNQ